MLLKLYHTNDREIPVPEQERTHLSRFHAEGRPFLCTSHHSVMNVIDA